MTENLKNLKEQIVSHKLYSQIVDEASLYTFMQHHIFCVWDFQCLLKKLQQHFTCTTVPWIPSADPEARYLINEIVLEEESDVLPDGTHLSHFELYINAMKEAGCDSSAIENLIDALRSGQDVKSALPFSGTPAAIQDFLHTTFSVIENGQIHEIAAFFTHGREDLIPSMFRSLISEITSKSQENWQTFEYYLERHIEVDEENHGPMAQQLIERICAGDPQKIVEAEQAAIKALEARLQLWGCNL